MERVILIGCGGSGKSTLARQLGEKTGIPVVHLDKLYWRSNWNGVSKEEFDTFLEQELEKPQWIMDGNFNRTLPRRLQECDTVIYLDFSRWICIWSVLKRVWTYHGTTRPDMGENCQERLDFGFLRWVWNYNSKNRENNYKLLKEQKNVKIIILKNRRQVRKFLESV